MKGKTRRPGVPGKAYTCGVIVSAILAFGVVRFAVAFVREVRRLDRAAKRRQAERRP